MIRSAAHERLLLPSFALGLTPANLRRSSLTWIAGRWRRVAFVLLLATGIYRPARAQAIAGPAVAPVVRAEFQTAPRSLITQAIDRSRFAPAPGAVRSEAASAQDLGPRDPSAPLEHVQLVLRRPQERQAAFDAEVVALHQYGNPSYHQWLTPEVIGPQFGPSASDLATLTAYLRTEGFTVNNVGKSGMYVDFSGTVAQIEQSFHTQIHNLHMANGEERYSAISEAQIPEALAPLVVGFRPIGNVLLHPLISHVQPPIRAPGTGDAQFRTRPEDTEGGNYFLGSQDFYTIYNETPLIGAVNGSGVTIALLEQTDINSSDVTAFRTMTGVSPATPGLTIDNGPGVVGCADPGTNGDEDEAVLDTEWSGAVAPAATLRYVACQNVGISTELAVDENIAQVLSLSYGEAETDPSGGSGDFNFFSTEWEQAAAQGQTVVVSSGDAGSANSDDQAKSIASHGLTVNALSSSAYNVSAGGTDFQDTYNYDEGDTSYGPGTFWNATNGAGLSSATSYVPETPWNDTCASSIRNYLDEESQTDPNPVPTALCDAGQYLPTGGGGGGVSIYQARPTWQSGTVYGLPSTGNRLLPDISLFASNGNWGHALDYYQSDVSTSMEIAGGTSFVAPQLAGVFALIVQKTGERLGQPDFVLYSMAGTEYGTIAYTAGNTCNGSGASGVGTTTSLPASSCIFYDIETGNNSQACSNGSPNCYVDSGSQPYGVLSTSLTAADPGYPAGQGYDEATGLGSVNIANLVNNYQNAEAGGITYTPTVTVTAAPSSYTYGHPSSINFTATVSGSGSFPTGSVTFSGPSPILTIGNDPLVGSNGCDSGGSCTESASQAYTPPGTLPGGSYTITGAYLSTNENYASGSGTKTLTVNKQTPTVAVSAVNIGVGTAMANLSATIAYTGSGVAPTGELTFKVGSGATVTASCTGSSSPLTCTYNNYSTSGLAVNSYTITATTIADGNYAAATGINTLKVLPLPTITFTVPNHHTMDLPFTVSASSNSTGAITYSVVSGPATISVNSVTLTGAAGTVELEASQAQSASYGAGTQTASFSVIANSVWLGNGTGSLSAFDLTGAAITGSSGFINGGVGTIASPLGLAFDASGNMWVASSNGVSEFTRQGIAYSSTASTAGGISSPEAIAIDGAGQVWVANANGTVSVLSNAGAAVSPAAGYCGPATLPTGYCGAATTPAGIAVDISGSVWIPSSSANTVTRILGAATPVVPLATGATSGPGVEP